MKTFDTSLLVFEAADVISGIEAHEVIARASDVEIVEAAPIGDGRFLVLATGDASILERASQTARETISRPWIDQIVIANVARGVLEGALSLSQVKLNGCLIAVETGTVSGVFAAAQELVSKGGKCIELKIRRSSRGAHAYFSVEAGAADAAAEAARTVLKKSNGTSKVAVFKEPSAALRSLFDFVD